MGPPIHMHPYFLRLRRDAIPLSSHEIRQARPLISALESRSIDIEQELNTALCILNDILKRHKDIQREVSLWRHLLSPIRRVPPDVLRNIFIHCLPEEGNPAMHADEAPLLLGRVCASWRRVAWEMPQLWDSIHIVVPDIDCIRASHAEAALEGFTLGVEEWLKRSGTRPLSISMIDDTIFDMSLTERACPQEQLTISLLDTISAHSTRWKDVRLKLPIELIYSYLYPTHLPLLDTLYFQTTNHLGLESPEHPYSNLIHPILETPSLRRLHLADASLFDGMSSPPNWTSLAQLSLGGSCGYPANQMVSLQVASTILAHCHKLKTCKLHVFSGNEELFVTRTIGLSQLVDFTVIVAHSTPTPSASNASEGFLYTFFDSLILPNLSTFGYVSSSAVTSLPFISLLKRPNRLHTLKLFAIGALSAQLSQVLALSHNVKELHLSSGISRQIISSLNYILSDGRPVCPRLQALKLDCNSAMDALKQPLLSPNPARSQRYLDKVVERNMRRDINERVKFLWARLRLGQGQACDGKPLLGVRPPISELRSIEFSLHKKFKEDVLTRVRPLMEAGLRVVLHEDRDYGGDVLSRGFAPCVRWEEE